MLMHMFKLLLYMHLTHVGHELHVHACMRASTIAIPIASSHARVRARAKRLQKNCLAVLIRMHHILEFTREHTDADI